jgi:hypothetical protein
MLRDASALAGRATSNGQVARYHDSQNEIAGGKMLDSLITVKSALS